MIRPSPGSAVYWRFKRENPSPWSYGYCTYAQGDDLLRMGRWNGDVTGGQIVSASEIEWKPHESA